VLFIFMVTQCKFFLACLTLKMTALRYVETLELLYKRQSQTQEAVPLSEPHVSHYVLSSGSVGDAAVQCCELHTASFLAIM